MVFTLLSSAVLSLFVGHRCLCNLTAWRRKVSMAMSSQHEIKALEDTLVAVNLTKYLSGQFYEYPRHLCRFLILFRSAASYVVFLYDCLLTLPDEVRLVWKTKMTLAKVLYYFIRIGTMLGLTWTTYRKYLLNRCSMFSHTLRSGWLPTARLIAGKRTL